MLLRCESLLLAALSLTGLPSGGVLHLRHGGHGAVQREGEVLRGGLQRPGEGVLWKSAAKWKRLRTTQLLQEQLQQRGVVLRPAAGAHRGQPVARYPFTFRETSSIFTDKTFQYLQRKKFNILPVTRYPLSQRCS